MNIIDFFRANYYYYSNRFSRIIPIKFTYVFMNVWFVILLLAAILTVIPFPDRDYYKVDVQGKVEQIERGDKNWNIKVDSNWYFVQKPKIHNIEIGRTIVKKPNSWVFTIYDSLGNRVYQDSIRKGTFRLLKNKKP